MCLLGNYPQSNNHQKHKRDKPQTFTNECKIWIFVSDYISQVKTFQGKLEVKLHYSHDFSLNNLSRALQ